MEIVRLEGNFESYTVFLKFLTFISFDLFYVVNICVEWPLSMKSDFANLA